MSIALNRSAIVKAPKSAASAVRPQQFFPWFLAAVLLLLFQLASGTGIAYALLILLFNLIFLQTMRLVGGVRTLTGCCVCFFGLQNIIISQVAKIILWQPADTPLFHPIETMTVYVLVMLGICSACWLLSRRRLQVQKPLFVPEVDPQRLMWLAYIFTALSVSGFLIVGVHGVDSETGAANTGGIFGALRALPPLGPLSVACGTAYTVISSQGKRSLGLVNGIAMAFPLLFGLIGASREQIIIAFIIYYVTCFAFRFKFRPVHYAVLFGIVYTAQFILFPYALYARGIVRTRNFNANVQNAASLLVDVIGNPIKYQEKNAKVAARSVRSQVRGHYFYYGFPVILDRSSLIIYVDGIVDATLRDGTTEFETIVPGFEMAMPRFLLPDKPYASTSNLLAHRQPGLVGKKDYGTGITIGPAADSFSSFGWFGAFIIPFVYTLTLFAGFRYVIRDQLQNNVFALCMIFQFPWHYAGGPIADLIVELLQTVPLMVLTFFVAYRLVDFMMRAQNRLRETRLLGQGRKLPSRMENHLSISPVCQPLPVCQFLPGCAGIVEKRNCFGL